jgi:hypothetical protein
MIYKNAMAEISKSVRLSEAIEELTEARAAFESASQKADELSKESYAASVHRQDCEHRLASARLRLLGCVEGGTIDDLHIWKKKDDPEPASIAASQ